MPRRRANGEGNLVQRSDGRWQGSITIGYDGRGRQKRRYAYGRTQREAREKLDELRRQFALGVHGSEGLKVNDFLKQWRDEKAKSIKPRTVEIYETLSKHLERHIGSLKLDKVRASDVSNCIAQIADEVGTPTANKARTMLFGAFRLAVKWRMLAWNPVEAVDRLREEPRPMVIWTSQEAAMFIAHTAGDRLFPAIFLMMATGLRRGEVLGLEWTDLDRARVHVQRSVGIVKGELTVSTPKTLQGARIVTLADDALQVLVQHRRRQDAERSIAQEAWQPSDRVFTTEIGSPLTPMMLTHAWNRMQERAGVRHVRLHDLRHLHVSLLVREGFDPRTIADRIGHSDPAFTLRRYSHMFEEQRAAAAVNLTQLLRQDGAVTN